ncbi:hypothetical protein ABW19_dt0209210 [Dactylella cylindrospora]|nr:hypothetical protein ABW19_dt0209210 [Dactylella cylindrospora]
MQTPISWYPLTVFRGFHPNFLASNYICHKSQRYGYSYRNVNMATSVAELALSGQVDPVAWETATSTYDAADWQRDMTAKILNFIQKNASWLGLSSPPAEEVKVLDYACGPGVVSLALLPYSTTILGIDINPNQTTEYNRRANTLTNLPTTLIRALPGDLLTPTPPASFSTPEFFNFTYAISSLAFHHIDSPSLGVLRLAERVKSGGKVVLIEFVGREDDGGRVISLDPEVEEDEERRKAEEERRERNVEYRSISHDNRRLARMMRGEFGGQGGKEVGEEVGEDEGEGEDHHHHQEGESRETEGHGHGHKHRHGHGHGPHGFKIEDLEKLFRDTGLVDVKSQVMEDKVEIMGFNDWEIFMIQGTKV